MKIAYFDCFSGISGNMIIGSFLSAGVPLEYLKMELTKLQIPDEYELVTEYVEKLGIGAYYFDVRLTHSHHVEHEPRNMRDILNLIGQSALPPAVKNLSLQIFKRLGEAEAKVHRCSVDEVHLHEIGAVDAIVDIVGSSICYHYLGIKKVYSSHLHVGSGMVKCTHGLMPIPAPATAELLKGVPFYSTEILGELVTPTGAAIITTLASKYGPIPPLRPETIGYGAGTCDLSILNVVRLFLCSTEVNSFEKNVATIIESTIDDMNPEFYTHLIDKLFLAGAADVFLTPIYMKKNRPGVLISITSHLPNHQPLLDVVFRESTTIGIRMYPVEGLKLQKSFFTVETSFGPVKVKLGKSDEKILNIAPEFEDCRHLASKTGAPLKEIYQEALAIGYQYLKLNNES